VPARCSWMTPTRANEPRVVDPLPPTHARTQGSTLSTAGGCPVTPSPPYHWLSCQERPTTPRPSPHYPAAASGWSRDMAEEPARRTAPSRWCGVGRGGRRMAAATGSRPARATGRPGRGQRRHLAWRWVVAAGTKVQVHPAALPLDLVDLAFAVVLAAGLEGQQLGVPRECLEGCQDVFHCHALSVATPVR
jgi:hypothetical protein